MADLYHEQTVKLTAEDVNNLRGTINKMPVIFFIMLIVGAVITYLTDSGIIGISVFGAIMLFIFYAFYAGSKSYRKLIAKGTKVILQGIITRRYDRYPDDDTDSMKEYILRVGDREIQVDLSTYQKYKPGDAVEIHYIPMGYFAQFVLSHSALPEYRFLPSVDFMDENKK